MPTEVGTLCDSVNKDQPWRLRMITNVPKASREDRMIMPHSERVGIGAAAGAGEIVMFCVTCGAAL